MVQIHFHYTNSAGRKRDNFKTLNCTSSMVQKLCSLFQKKALWI